MSAARVEQSAEPHQCGVEAKPPRRVVEPAALSGGVGQGEEQPARRPAAASPSTGSPVHVEQMPPTSRRGGAGEQTGEGEAADREHQAGDRGGGGRRRARGRSSPPRPDRGGDRRRRRAAAREAGGRRGDPDPLAEGLLVGEPGSEHPAHQLAAGPAGEGPADVVLHRSRRLADEEDPLPRPPAEHRVGGGDEPGVGAAGAGAVGGGERPQAALARLDHGPGLSQAAGRAPLAGGLRPRRGV